MQFLAVAEGSPFWGGIDFVTMRFVRADRTILSRQIRGGVGPEVEPEKIRAGQAIGRTLKDTLLSSVASYSVMDHANGFVDVASLVWSWTRRIGSMAG